jgi:divalent metal cation (Fe/Co/Zn/Cd) transporter
MYAVAQDHLNDVFSNIIALACGIVGKKKTKTKYSHYPYFTFLAAKALQGSIKAIQAVVVDPVGAIVISLYIIICWLKQLREQVRNLSGYAAEPEFLQKITWLTLHHSPLIKQIDTVRAFHFGISFLVEVEIILPELMTLKEAHDIGASLKDKLEQLPEVELAFVRLDYTIDALKY